MSVDPSAAMFPIDVDRYMAMAESGVFEDCRVELVDGMLIEMSPIFDQHVWATIVLSRHFVVALAEHPHLVAGGQGSIMVSRFSVPEPDFFVISHRRFDFSKQPRRPVSGPVLVGEVSVSSLRWDLVRKRRLYAEAGIPEYWVLDVNGERLVVHRDLDDGDYTSVTEHGRGEPVAPADVPVPPFDVAVALDPPQA